MHACAAERDQLQQDADEEAELEEEQEDMVDSPAKRQRLEQGAGRQSRCALQGAEVRPFGAALWV